MAMKAVGIKLTSELDAYYRKEAKAMGVSLGARIRRILEMHKDAEQRAERGSRK